MHIFVLLLGFIIPSLIFLQVVLVQWSVIYSDTCQGMIRTQFMPWALQQMHCLPSVLVRGYRTLGSE